MTWEQKLVALQALGDVSLVMRKPGDWYLSQDKSVCLGETLEGRYGNGTTPQEAVEDDWKAYTNLAPKEYIVARNAGNRVCVRWNGFMWADASHLAK